MSDWLEEIEARANAATPGPWESRRFRYVDGSPAMHIDVVPVDRGDLRPTLPIAWNGAVGGDDDMAFIAYARTDIARLIARVRELEAQAERDGAARTLADAVLERIAADEAFTAYEAHYWASNTIGQLAGCEARYEQFNGRTERATANEKAAIDAYVAAREKGAE